MGSTPAEGASKEQGRFLIKGEWWNGIHERLKIFCPQGYKGSTPFSPTRTSLRLLYQQMRNVRVLDSNLKI